MDKSNKNEYEVISDIDTYITKEAYEIIFEQENNGIDINELIRKNERYSRTSNPNMLEAIIINPDKVQGKTKKITNIKIINILKILSQVFIVEALKRIAGIDTKEAWIDYVIQSVQKLYANMTIELTRGQVIVIISIYQLEQQSVEIEELLIKVNANTSHENQDEIDKSELMNIIISLEDINVVNTVDGKVMLIEKTRIVE